MQDTYGYKADLKYVRDLEGREADFVITVDNKPFFIVEAKLNNTQISKELLYLKNKLNPKQTFLVTGSEDTVYVKDGVLVVPAGEFLAGLV